MAEQRVDNDGIEIVYDVEGPDDGPPVILLHGFPDSARLWRHQVPALVDAGYRVITPDLRGYSGRSAKPEAVEAYHLFVLASDVVAVLDHAGADRARVVGHDWGAALAWGLATFAPERVVQLVALSVGHPSAFAAAGPRQRKKSWYMLLFQFPGVAEDWLAGDGWANFREWSSHPDVDAATATLDADGSLTPGLNWYRATMSPESFVGPPPELAPVQAPTMGIWSSGDMALTEVQMTGSAEHCTNGFRYERIDGAGHWIPLERPDQINHLLLDFFAG